MCVCVCVGVSAHVCACACACHAALLYLPINETSANKSSQYLCYDSVTFMSLIVNWTAYICHWLLHVLVMCFLFPFHLMHDGPLLHACFSCC